MSVCPHCQHQVPEDSKFCPSCGGNLHQPSDDEMSSFVGRVLNQKYKLIEELAEGGMAVVYKAEHIFLDDLCAVKIIKRSLASKDEMLKRFQREARLTRQVARRSPYVIAIYDFGVEEQVGFFYVMELLNGRPFTDLIHQTDQLPDPEIAVRFVCQMCEALAVVHDEGLVHRDIKPDNIFLHKEAGQDQEMVKLLDFGIARPTYAKATMLTSYGRVMGTPEYMSPEQCRGPTPQQYERGESHLDGRSDIYSLGVLLYQCLTGEVPFPMPVDGGPMAIHKVMAGHVMEEATNPIEKRDDDVVTAALADATLKALAKEPDDRFQTMLEFRDALINCFPALQKEFRGSTDEVAPQPELDTVPMIGVDFDKPAIEQPVIEQPVLDEAPAEGLFGQTPSMEAQYEDLSLDRTALDVQLPPEFLEQAQAHLNAQASNNPLPQTPHEQNVAVPPSASTSWGNESEQSGELVEDIHTGSEEVDLAKTVATSFAPEVVQELRDRAAVSIYGQDPSSVSTQGTGRRDPDTVPASKSGPPWLWIGLGGGVLVIVAVVLYFFLFAKS